MLLPHGGLFKQLRRTELEQPERYLPLFGSAVAQVCYSWHNVKTSTVACYFAADTLLSPRERERERESTHYFVRSSRRTSEESPGVEERSDVKRFQGHPQAVWLESNLAVSPEIGSVGSSLAVSSYVRALGNIHFKVPNFSRVLEVVSVSRSNAKAWSRHKQELLPRCSAPGPG